MWKWVPRKESHVIYAALGILVVWGFVLRVYQAGEQSLWVDEATSISAAMGILESGTPHLPSGVSYWRAPLHSYAMAFTMLVGGVNEFAARVPAIICGTLAIPATFALGRRLATPAAGLAAAALLTFATVEVAWSRQARMYQPLQLLAIVAILAYFQALERPSRASVGVLALAVVACLGTHTQGFLVALALAGHFTLLQTYEGWRKHRKGEPLGRGPLLALAGVSVGLLVLAVSQVAEGAVSRALATRANYFGAYWGYLREDFPLVLAVAVVGVFQAFRRQPSLNWLLLLLAGLTVYLAAFHQLVFATRYIFLLLPILFVWFGAALAILQQDIGVRWRAPHALLAPVGMAALVTGAHMFVPQSHVYIHWTSPQPDFKAAYAYIEENRKPGDVVIDTWPGVGRFYLSQPPEYWLQVNTTGVSSRDYCVVERNLREIYANALCVTTTSEFERVVEDFPSGWIVLDVVARERLPSASIRLLENIRFNRIGRSQANLFTGMLVFKWPNMSP